MSSLSPRKTRFLALAGALAATAGVALAQPSFGPSNTVTWTATVDGSAPVKPGAKVKVALKGAVLDTWHVYGLHQLPEGPTPPRATRPVARLPRSERRGIKS